MIRRLLVPVVVLVALVAGAAACGDDAADDAPTTEADAGTDPGEDTSTTTAADTTDTADGETTTEPGDTSTTADPDVTTTSPNLAPNDSPLADLLLAPSQIGDGFAPDDSLGDGSFDGDLCEEVTVESTFDDEASQALLEGAGDDAVSFTQSVMRFADEEVAQTFLDAVVDGIQQCSPDAEVTEVDAGDASTLLTDDVEDLGGITGGLVRVGDLVSWTTSLAGPGLASPNTDALLATVADQLTA